MIQFVSDQIWTKVKTLARKAKRKSTAVAYVTDDSIFKFGKGDTLIVDASDSAVAMGQTSAKLLSDALERKAKIYSCPTLHSKVFVFDNIAVVGSSNISMSSQDKLNEAAIITDRPEIVSGAIQMINQLCDPKNKVDEDFIDRIKKIPVRPPKKGKKHRRKKITIQEGRCWLLGGSQDSKYPGDKEVVEKIQKGVHQKEPAAEIDWIFWTGPSKFRREAKPGDYIILIIRPKKRNLSTKGVCVYKHAVIRKVFQEKGIKATTYYCSWPEDSEETALKWSQFQKLSEKVGINKISLNSCRELSAKKSSALLELWD